MNILGILNDVLGQSGFLQKASFFGTQDPDDIQMINIANRTAYEIYNFYTWSALRKTFSLTMEERFEGYTPGGKNPPITPDTVYLPIYYYPLPADFKSGVSDSAWEKDGSRQVDFSTPERGWYMYKFAAFSDGGILRARIHAGMTQAPDYIWNDLEYWGLTGSEAGFIEVHDPQPGETFLFEYITSGPVIPENTVDSPRDSFEADTDTWILDDQLLTLGIQYQWALTKVLPQKDEWKDNYYKKMNEAISRDVPAQTIGGFPNSDWLTRRSPYYPLYRK